MKKKLVTALTISSILLLGACSSADAIAPSNATPEVASTTATASPTASPEVKKTLPAELSAIDIKFKVTGATAQSPYGIDYSSFGGQSSEADNAHYTAKDVENATRTVMDTYYKLRTDPRLFKDNRTPKSDDKVVRDYSLGKYVMDDWKDYKEEGNLFDYVYASPVINYEGFIESEDENSSKPKKLTNYYIDTTKVQNIEFHGANVEPLTIDRGDSPGLGFYFTESVDYALANGGKASRDASIQMYLEKNSKGKWIIQGLFWQSFEQSLKDSKGKDLPH